MNTDDLFRLYDEVTEICRGTDLHNKPYKCLQYRKEGRDWVTFDNPINLKVIEGTEIRRAIRVLDGKPIFTED